MRRARVWRAAAPPGWLFVDSAPAEASKSLGGHQEFCSAWNYVESDGVVDRNDDHRVAALLPLGRKEDVLAGCADEQAQVGVLEVVAAARRVDLIRLNPRPRDEQALGAVEHELGARRRLQRVRGVARLALTVCPRVQVGDPQHTGKGEGG